MASAVRQRPVPHADPCTLPPAGSKKTGDLTVELDELRSFVGGKARPWWVWTDPDADTRQVVAMVVGDRSEDTARRRWATLPAAYRDRDRAVAGTDFWSADRAVVLEERHASGGKASGLTCGVERFWCTRHQRCGRFVRRTLSFSKCDCNHVGTLWCFIRLHNHSRRCRT